MHELSFRICDDVLPEVPLRQWVISPPPELVGVLGSRYEILSELNRIFVGAVSKRIHARAKQEGVVGGQTGSVTFIQRFSNSLLIFPHLHSVFLDGVYSKDDDTPPVFHLVSAPTKADTDAVASEVERKLVKFLKRKGLVSDEPPDDREETPLDRWYANVLRQSNELVTVDEKGNAERVGAASSKKKKSPHAFSVHAETRVGASDREGRERLIRYCSRPPIADAQLSLREDGRVMVELKKPHASGATHIVLEPVALLRRLAWLVPPPKKRELRFSGVLAPNSKLRKSIAPKSLRQQAARAKLKLSSTVTSTKNDEPVLLDEEQRWLWAEMLRRTYCVDALECARCGGRLEPIAVISAKPPRAGPEGRRMGTNGAVVAKILEHVGLSSQAPAFARSRGPP